MKEIKTLQELKEEFEMLQIDDEKEVTINGNEYLLENVDGVGEYRITDAPNYNTSLSIPYDKFDEIIETLSWLFED